MNMDTRFRPKPMVMGKTGDLHVPRLLTALAEMFLRLRKFNPKTTSETRECRYHSECPWVAVLRNGAGWQSFLV